MFSRRSHKSHMPQMEDKLNESPCSTSLKERRKPHAISTKPRWLRGMNISPMPDNENREEGTIEGGWMLLEQRVEHLVPAVLGRDPSYLFTFLRTYRTFATTQQVLEILFMRYGCFHSEAEEDGGPREQEKLAISSILGTWLDHYPEEFFRPPDFTSLKLLRAYVRAHMPGSELQRRARLLYSWRKHPLAAALEPRPDVPRERAPAISGVPTAASRPRLPEATSSPGAQRVRESETLTAASPPGQEVLPALADSQELEEPPAPLVAPEHEQPPAPAGGVTERLEQPPAAAEQPASAPQQRLMSAAAPQDEFPDLVIVFFIISVVVIAGTRVQRRKLTPESPDCSRKGAQEEPGAQGAQLLGDRVCTTAPRWAHQML
ncbi:ral guanine nucleotide dissociation stimulator-like [Prionailurus viverrinus]|uniref:ral guanine nucleotide dissociation stimulator-like n=1 Tax=Prionailurus viverrinus TaxID=61388 RepID=UPI001FF472A1|nr:ral guanine nucleotide dissociation stimulator-like [Prionailurus viverrinus]